MSNFHEYVTKYWLSKYYYFFSFFCEKEMCRYHRTHHYGDVRCPVLTQINGAVLRIET